MISGAADPARAARAMAAVDEHLVRRGDGLVLLFTPPFDQHAARPGYIKGYPPGIRENGGQYTHAAIWSVIAFAMLGDGDKAGELFSILNPINHASTRAAVHRYKVEPYVVCADVYATPPHVGRGGWTWYTGSAGWMYRAGLEWILGFRVRGATLLLDPCVPRAWRGFEIVFRYHSARYDIAVENPRGVSRGVARVELDGAALAETRRADSVDGRRRDPSGACHPGMSARHGANPALLVGARRVSSSAFSLSCRFEKFIDDAQSMTALLAAFASGARGASKHAACRRGLGRAGEAIDRVVLPHDRRVAARLRGGGGAPLGAITERQPHRHRALLRLVQAVAKERLAAAHRDRVGS